VSAREARRAIRGANSQRLIDRTETWTVNIRPALRPESNREGIEMPNALRKGGAEEM
jgi:hypothetical protein